MRTSELPPGDWTPEIEALVQSARRNERAARRSEARRCYERALRALDSSRQASVAACLMRWIGRTHADEGDADAALDCYEVAHAVASASGDAVGAASAVNCQAAVAFGRGRLEEAEELWEIARRAARAHQERELLAMVEQNLGNVASIHGDLEVALVRYRAALREYRRLGLDSYVAPLLNNLGMTLTDLGRWNEAEAALDEGVALARRHRNVSIHVLLEVSRARLHAERKCWERARASCDAAHELALEADDSRWLGEIFKHYGAVFRETGRPRLAQQHLSRAREMALEQEDLLLQAEIAREEAELHRTRGRNRDTLRALNRAHALFAELRARHRLADVDRRMRRLEDDFLTIVREWGESIESQDTYTQGHCERVADYACRLARAVGFPEEFLIWFRMGALLHDVGKVAVPEEILNKPGTLTPAEWDVMQSHCEEGVRLLGDVEFPWDVRPMILHHHERWDGSGYPDGIGGREIALSARILCVADVYDALTTDRSYRDAHSSARALDLMVDEAGSTFDPELVSVFVAMMREETDDDRPSPGSPERPSVPMDARRVEAHPVGAPA